jgi:hypothetical protein
MLLCFQINVSFILHTTLGILFVTASESRLVQKFTKKVRFDKSLKDVRELVTCKTGVFQAEVSAEIRTLQ